MGGREGINVGKYIDWGARRRYVKGGGRVEDKGRVEDEGERGITCRHGRYVCIRGRYTYI